MRTLKLTVFNLLLVAGLTAACGDDDGATGSGGASSSSSTAASTTGSGGAGGSVGNGGSTGDGGSGGSATCVAFADSCDAATDTCCDVAGATGECYAFGMGSRCTIPCPADPMDCPNNGAGCNNQTPAVCKVE